MMSNNPMTTEELLVINGAKAVARALRRWTASPTLENEGKLNQAQQRLNRFVERLESVEHERREAERRKRIATIIDLDTHRSRRQ